MWEQLMSEAVVREADARRAHAALVREVRAAQRTHRAERRQRWKHWWSNRPTAQSLGTVSTVRSDRVGAAISRPLHG